MEYISTKDLEDFKTSPTAPVEMYGEYTNVPADEIDRSMYTFQKECRRSSISKKERKRRTQKKKLVRKSKKKQ